MDTKFVLQTRQLLVQKVIKTIITYADAINFSICNFA